MQESLQHQGYINLLTDPECGVPITGTNLHCSCDRLPESYRECRFNADSTNGQLGELQVRFTRRIEHWLDFFKEEADYYAARRKLYRRIPAHLAGGSPRMSQSQ
ncbi:hypothetical protein [Streptomyces sp. NEAU-S7GS2]|uniref:hypothetical protein n=1 Tax=Streptomyces sp. NEAU-S7GS2 TaxID=2202000 RepID=UPI000D6EF561|nr:hypothetical protein [Streptomyces sp. NEAU-S7GS2]AWN29964.1 hypothetical protein DKG71_30745 [Streptomyces sp. NEAU-S7GS2]